MGRPTGQHPRNCGTINCHDKVLGTAMMWRTAGMWMTLLALLAAAAGTPVGYSTHSGAGLAEGADPANLIQLVTVHDGGSVAAAGSGNTGVNLPGKIKGSVPFSAFSEDADPSRVRQA